MLNIVLIDDEENAIISLDAMFKNFFSDITVIGRASNSLDGIKCINKTKPDIVFLDINMPNIDGFEMLELLTKRDFKVVITSGYENHALKAIKHKVDDFLLKPIDIEELEKVVGELRIDIEQKKGIKSELVKLIDQNQTIYIKQDQIKYIKADGRYSEVVSVDKKFVMTKNLGEYEQELDKKLFFRIHRSYLINRQFVKHITNNNGGFLILEDDTEIEISRRKRNEFLDFMNG